MSPRASRSELTQMDDDVRSLALQVIWEHSGLILFYLLRRKNCMTSHSQGRLLEKDKYSVALRPVRWCRKGKLNLLYLFFTMRTIYKDEFNYALWPVANTNYANVTISSPWQMALKCADLGHLTASREVHRRWVTRLESEFFAQGDREREALLPISPLMDRTREGVTKSQPGVRGVKN